MILKKNILSSELDDEFQKIQSEILKQNFPIGFPDLAIFILSEISANISEHSKAKNAEIEISIKKKKMKIKISDNGIGIRKSYLINNLFAKDDKSAILLALSGISTKNLNERAFGLFSIQQLVENQNGKMEIESGKSKVKITKSKMEFSENKKNKKGVAITVFIDVKKVNIYTVIK